MGKLEFTDWSGVQQMSRFGEIAIFRQRMMIPPLPPGTQGSLKVATNFSMIAKKSTAKHLVYMDESHVYRKIYWHSRKAYCLAEGTD